MQTTLVAQYTSMIHQMKKFSKKIKKTVFDIVDKAKGFITKSSQNTIQTTVNYI
jgi:hypothetical protein